MAKSDCKINDIEKIADYFVRNSVKCSCSHTIAIPPNVDRVICHWCNHWVYKSKEIEEKYKRKEFQLKLKNYLR